MIHELLTDANFLLYCASHYDKRHYVDDEEFYTDLNRIKYIKKLLTRYEQTGDLKERLILNHIIVLSNIFGPYHATRILFLKLGEQFKLIKPFLILLELLPDKLYNIHEPNTIYETDDYPLDSKIVDILRKI